jgi:hypothetical protein
MRRGEIVIILSSKLFGEEASLTDTVTRVTWTLKASERHSLERQPVTSLSSNGQNYAIFGV